MCGIAGIINNNSEIIDNYIDSALLSLERRGPDQQSKIRIANCGLAHTRLSIIDLDGGLQPMKSSMQDVYLVFNGEIYGYKEIRNNSQLCGNYSFKTKSDSEVILALYYQFGEDFLKYLPGCFAFALWDNEKKKLFCARDRFGEKPLYYALTDKGLVFSSSTATIIKSELINKEINVGAVIDFVQFGYIRPQHSIYKNIATLKPGHYFTFSNNKFDLQSFWELPETNLNINYNEAKEQFNLLFRKAVKNQMIADVEVGIFLSGGLDSSTIVGVASEYNSKIKTFAFRLDARDNHDHLYAEMVAKQYNTEHHVLNSTDFDFVDLLLKMPEIYDEPVADQACMLQHLIAAEARKEVKVVLAGEGGDELLAGYSHHRYLYDRNIFYQLDPIHYCLKKILRVENKQLFSEGYFKDVNQFFYNYPIYAKFSDQSKLKNLIKDYAKTHRNLEKINNLDQMLRFDLQNYLIGNCIVKLDRATMYNSLESRLPFLDYDLADFLISLPIHMKIRKNFNKTITDKLILRDVFGDKLPLAVRNRDKAGFGPPPFNQTKLYDLGNEFLGNSQRKIFSQIDFTYVKNKLNSSNEASFVHDNFLVRLLQLSIWFEKYL